MKQWHLNFQEKLFSIFVSITINTKIGFTFQWKWKFKIVCVKLTYLSYNIYQARKSEFLWWIRMGFHYSVHLRCREQTLLPLRKCYLDKFDCCEIFLCFCRQEVDKQSIEAAILGPSLMSQVGLQYLSFLIENKKIIQNLISYYSIK